MDKQGAREGVIERTESRENYGGKCTVGGGLQSCYTKRQMKSLYPTGKYVCIGEYAADSKEKRIGNLHLGGRLMPLYRNSSHSRLLYREQGFIAVDENRYVVVLQNVIIPRALALMLCAAVVAAGILFGPALFGRDARIAGGDGSLASVSNIPDLESGAVDWEGVQPRDTGGVAAGIAIPGYKSITIDANRTDVKVNLQNPEGNPCYFVISLILNDGTVLYQSKMIEPGKGLYDIALAQALSPGQYGAVVKYETYSLDDLGPMNGAEVQITLIVQ